MSDRLLGIELIVEFQGCAGYEAENKAKFWFGEGTGDDQKQNNSPIRMFIAFRAISTEAVDQFYRGIL